MKVVTTDEHAHVIPELLPESIKPGTYFLTANTPDLEGGMKALQDLINTGFSKGNIIQMIVQPLPMKTNIVGQGGITFYLCAIVKVP